jgi:hypothetical protein
MAALPAAGKDSGEAQRFPADYDGIAVGAPANYWPQLLASDLQTLQAVTERPENWVSPDKLASIVRAPASVSCLLRIHRNLLLTRKKTISGDKIFHSQQIILYLL